MITPEESITTTLKSIPDEIETTTVEKVITTTLSPKAVLEDEEDSIPLTTEKAVKDITEDITEAIEEITEVIEVTDGPPEPRIEPEIEITTEAIIEATTKYLEEAQETTIGSIPIEDMVVTTTSKSDIQTTTLASIEVILNSKFQLSGLKVEK